MEIIFAEDERFEKTYKDFIDSNSNVTWAYLPKFVQYQKLYSGARFYKDVSFIILEGKNPVCISPLIIEKINGVNSFSNANSYLRAPICSTKLDKKFSKKIEKKSFEVIDQLATENNIAKLMMLVDPLNNNLIFNFLTEYGFLDSTISTCILDLEFDDVLLWSNLRKSFQSLINNGLKGYEIVIVDKSNPLFEVHEKYRELHHKASGKITRDIETFQLQYEMLLDDNAILVGLKDGEHFVAFSYFFHFNRSIYYGSSSDDPDYQPTIPLEHTIIWAAIKYYKKRNFKFFEIGWQQFGEQIFDHPSSKDISISFFKRGFGGELRSLYRGIKYYDDELKKNELLNFIKQMK